MTKLPRKPWLLHLVFIPTGLVLIAVAVVALLCGGLAKLFEWVDDTLYDVCVAARTWRTNLFVEHPELKRRREEAARRREEMLASLRAAQVASKNHIPELTEESGRIRPMTPEEVQGIMDRVREQYRREPLFPEFKTDGLFTMDYVRPMGATPAEPRYSHDCEKQGCGGANCESCGVAA